MAAALGIGPLQIECLRAMARRRAANHEYVAAMSDLKEAFAMSKDLGDKRISAGILDEQTHMSICLYEETVRRVVRRDGRNAESIVSGRAGSRHLDNAIAYATDSVEAHREAYVEDFQSQTAVALGRLRALR